MKKILISIKPKWTAKILNGEKTIEVRKGTTLYNAVIKLIKEQGTAILIDNLKIFDEPKELWEFDSPNGFIPCEKCLLYKSFLEGKCKGQHCNSLYKAPQSYCFCEVNE